jgi:hypothetical protein
MIDVTLGNYMVCVIPEIVRITGTVSLELLKTGSKFLSRSEVILEFMTLYLLELLYDTGCGVASFLIQHQRTRTRLLLQFLTVMNRQFEFTTEKLEELHYEDVPSQIHALEDIHEFTDLSLFYIHSIKDEVATHILTRCHQSLCHDKMEEYIEDDQRPELEVSRYQAYLKTLDP